MTTLTLNAGTTTMISSGVTSYSSVYVGLLSTLDVTGTGTDVTLANIGAGVASTFEVSGGAILDLTSFVGISALNNFDIGNNGTLELGSGLNVGLLSPVTFQNTGGAAAQLVVDPGVNVSLLSPIDNWQAGDGIQLTGQTITSVSFSPGLLGGGVLTLQTTSGAEAIAFGNGTYTTANFSVSNGDDIIFACFAKGTLIDGPNGAVAVEDLAAGDPIRVASGATRPIKWIGVRQLDLTRYADPRIAHPVRIAAGALADGVPRRDLLLSPDHALVIGGKLMPARMLVNGMTIRREAQCRSVTYYHIELETHDIVLAEGAAVESYLDTGNRGMFENAGNPIAMRPDFADTTPDTRRSLGCCLPFAVDQADVRPAWDQLFDRACAAGHHAQPAQAATADPQLLLMMDGRRMRPVSQDGDRYVFALPARPGRLRLVSRSVVPADDRPWIDDRRRLGVMVRQIIWRSGNEHQIIPADDPRLDDGWWPAECADRGMGRWTNGDAALGPFPPRSMLTVELAGCAPSYPLTIELPASQAA